MRISKEYASLVCRKWQDERDSLKVTFETPGALLAFSFTGTVANTADGLVLITSPDDTLLTLDLNKAERFDFTDYCDPPEGEPPASKGDPVKGCLTVQGEGDHWYCKIERQDPWHFPPIR
jgi:hypothetical protein